jgi:hypothetical protein
MWRSIAMSVMKRGVVLLNLATGTRSRSARQAVPEGWLR